MSCVLSSCDNDTIGEQSLIISKLAPLINLTFKKNKLKNLFKSSFLILRNFASQSLFRLRLWINNDNISSPLQCNFIILKLEQCSENLAVWQGLLSPRDALEMRKRDIQIFHVITIPALAKYMSDCLE